MRADVRVLRGGDAVSKKPEMTGGKAAGLLYGATALGGVIGGPVGLLVGAVVGFALADRGWAKAIEEGEKEIARARGGR